MGMAATQARYLSLTARQNNLEYQGQQINQERSILSQQTAELYNSLIDMKVPVPPSTSDYTKVVYTGVSGTNTFTIGNVIPENGTYIVDLEYQKIGNYISEAYTVACQDIPPYISVQDVTTDVTPKQYSAYEVTGTYNTSTPPTSTDDIAYVLEPAQESSVIASGGWPALNTDYKLYKKDRYGYLVKVESGTEPTKEQAEDPTNGYFIVCKGDKVHADAGSILNADTLYSGGLTAEQLTSRDYYILESGNVAEYITVNDLNNPAKFTPEKNVDGQTVYKPTGSIIIGMKSTDPSAAQYKNPDSSNPNYRYYVAGEPCMSLEYARSINMISSDETFDAYIDAIKNTYSSEYGNLSGQELISRVSNDFDVYFTQGSSGELVPHFVKAKDLITGADINGTKYVSSYDYTPNGTYTSSERTKDCMLTFDLNGRISEIKIPTKRDASGNPLEYSTVKLNAATETDEKAYQDAYNEYVYKQAKYDKQQQEINAKTKIIQEEDRTLELRLRRLDTERQQITTEMDALEKVIKDNIDKSYKTFSG